MSSAFGDLNGSGNQQVWLNLYYISYNQAGNYSTWGWELRYYGNGYGSWDNSSTQYWGLSGFAVGSGTFTIPYAERFNTYKTLGSGTFTKGHDTAGYLAAEWMYGSIDTNHTSVGDGYAAAHTGTPPRIPKPPVAPTPVAVDQATVSSLRYRFSGGDNGGSAIIRYEFQYSTHPTFASGNSAVATSTGTSTITGQPRGTTVYFRSSGVNAIGTSPWSSIISGTTLHTVPDTPPAPAVTSLASTTVQLNLTDPAYVGLGVTARETQILKDGVLAKTSTANDPLITGLTRNTPYTVRTRVANEQGWSAWSTAPEFTTLTEAPSTPTGYVANNIASTTAYSTLGTILDNGGGALTRVDYQIGLNTTPGTITTLDTAREPLFTALTEGTLYYYRLRVFNGTLWSAWGAWTSFTTRSDVPTPPVNLEVDAVGDTTVTLVWEAPLDLNGATIHGYKVFVGSNKAITLDVQQVTVSVATLSQVFTGLSPLSSYYARIYAVSSNGDGSTTSVLAFATTGIFDPPKPLWHRILGVWKQGILWYKAPSESSALPGLIPGSPTAFPSLFAGVWKAGTLWFKHLGIWKTKL